MHGLARVVLLRGNVLVENGELVAKPGIGQFIKRAKFGEELKPARSHGGSLTRNPLEALALALLDGAVGAGVLVLALAHGGRRDVLAHFFVYAALVAAFKARDAARRVPALVAQARTSAGPLHMGPWWLRLARLLVGYDSWSRTERIGVLAISAIVCLLFGWDDGGPFAAALFVALALVNAGLALVALGARATRPRA